MADSLTEKLPHLVVKLPDAVHVLCIADIRRLANGEAYHGDKDLLIQVLARAVLNLAQTPSST